MQVAGPSTGPEISVAGGLPSGGSPSTAIVDVSTSDVTGSLVRAMSRRREAARHPGSAGELETRRGTEDGGRALETGRLEGPQAPGYRYYRRGNAIRRSS